MAECCSGGGGGTTRFSPGRLGVILVFPSGDVACHIDFAYIEPFLQPWNESS